MNFNDIKVTLSICFYAYIIPIILVIFLIGAMYFASIILSIGMDEKNQVIVNYGYLGSFLSGTLGIFLTAGSLVFLAKTLSFERKRSHQDNFEVNFFSLVNNFLNIKMGINRQDVEQVIQKIKSSDLENAKKIVRNYNYIYGDLFRNLYLILKFVDNHDSDEFLDKKFYTNLLRSYLPNELIQILAIHCYILEGLCCTKV